MSNMKTVKKIPAFKSYSEMGNFCDNHSLADFWDQTEPAQFSISADARHRYMVPVSQTLFKRIHKVANQRGVSTESVINLFIKQQLNATEKASRLHPVT